MQPKIVHIWAPSFERFGGGITDFSRELSAALVRSGSCVVEVGKDDGLSGSSLSIANRVLDRVASWVGSLRLIVRVIANVCQRRPDVIISTHVNFGPICSFVCRMFHIPYVLVAHGIEIGPALSEARLRALRHADAVWAVSAWTRDRLRELGIAVGMHSIIGNTVNHERFTVAEANPLLRERYGIGAGDKVILTVARIDAREGYKGVDRVIRSLAAIRHRVGSVRYLIVGDGSDRERLRTIASDSRVGDVVTFCGFISDEELPQHYGLANAFVMPSVGEGFGIAFLQSMCCGVPVLGGNRDGTCDALGNGLLGRLVDPYDEKALVEEIVNLLNRRGPEEWFDPARLRVRCLALHGRVAFSARVVLAISEVVRLVNSVSTGRGSGRSC